MKRILFLCAVIILHYVPSVQAAIVSANWDIVNTTGQDAFDFHVVVRPGLAKEPTAWVDGAFGKHESTTDAFGRTTTLKWFDGTVLKTKKTHVGVEFDSTRNTTVPFDAFWTNKNGDQFGDSVNLPGFEAHELSPQTEFSVINGTTQSLVFHDLQFQTLLSATPLDMLIAYTLPGFGASLPDFTLLPGQSMAFLPDYVGPNAFVLAQMTTYVPSDPANATKTVFQHGTSIPEPSTILLLATALVGLIGCSWRQGKPY